MNFFRSPFFLPLLYPTLTWRIQTDRKELYLTFDDGPVAGPTDFVLEQLRRVGAKATFFCIGDNVRKYPDVFNRVKAAGHAIGNHTFHHISGWKTSAETYAEDTLMCEQLLSTTTHNPQTTNQPLFRPPYGRITRNQIRSLHAYNIVMWDVLTHDYAKSIAPERCFRGSTAATRPGSIVVFHDSFKAERNLTHVLPRYLDHFAAEGYAFKSLVNS